MRVCLRHLDFLQKSKARIHIRLNGELRLCRVIPYHDGEKYICVFRGAEYFFLPKGTDKEMLHLSVYPTKVQLD